MIHRGPINVGARLGSGGMLAYLAPMRVLAIVTMMLAWLVYGTLSAWAGCPMCASMSASVDMASDAQHHHMGGTDVSGVDMAGMAADMGHAAKHTAPAKDPCATGGMPHMPFCSACLIVPPAVAVHADGQRPFSYPSPAIDAAFPGARPAPLAPPPRWV